MPNIAQCNPDLRAGFRIAPASLVTASKSRPHALRKGAQPNHKEWGVNSAQVNMFISCNNIRLGAIGADLWNRNLILAVDVDRRRRETYQNRRLRPRDVPISRKIPRNSQAVSCGAARRGSLGGRAANRRRSCDPLATRRSNPSS